MRNAVVRVAAVSLLVLGLGVAITVGASAQAASNTQAGSATNQALLTLAQNAAMSFNGLSSYAGVAIDPDGSHVDVYSSDPTVNLPVLQGTGATTRAVTVKYSMRQLDAVQMLIDRDRDYLKSAIGLVSYGFSPRENALVLNAADATSNAQQLVASRYNAGDAIRVVSSSGQLPTTVASRLYDAAAWNGGDFIAMDNGGDCSSGPAVKDSNGHRYILTAGHCFNETSNLPKTGYIYRVFQGSHVLSVGGPLIGYMSAERVNNGYDLAVTDPSAGASALNWRTAHATDTSPAAVTQNGAAGAVEGAGICFSGAFEGERCGAVVPTGGVNLTVSVCGSGYCSWTIHMVHAVNSTTWIVGPGDSGGPTYQVHSGGLLMTGVIIAQDNVTNVACPQNNPPPPQLARTCSYGGYFEDLPSDMVHLGVAIAP